ncbi:MAG: ComEC family competence protein [Chitinophagaceae bacterium]|nr:ComEC family competence protein [Chitinophagaceae bacterium]
MANYGSNFWKKTPFLKLLLSMMVGIVVQWRLQFSIKLLSILFVIAIVSLVVFFIIPFFNRFRLAVVNGLFTGLLFFCFGALLAWQKDIRNNQEWLGNFYQPKSGLVVTIDEPPVEKTKSVKSNATVQYLLQNDSIIPVKGKIIIYFKKDSALNLQYGTQLVFKKSLQEIKNSGNPGGFDYKRFCLFKKITHQVYLKPEEFEILQSEKQSWFRAFIYNIRQKVLNILRTNIQSKKELGLAEALLIGYKDDLEQSLVQSYTNTGVVHIIAISGLHLGLIYWLLSMLFKPLQKRKKTRWLRPILIITGLWIFSLLAGAQPSILRSALMFTCIVVGDSLARKPSIFNTMAVSAFILLCINPYFLWDVGFQLSYAAVLSIIIFMRPVYNWFYIKNKLLDFIWKLNAVTIAAQVLTVPLGIYHFHQFPNLFLLTNFLAVPLSSAILLGEIFLCVISFIPAAALLFGKLLTWLIRIMNTYIEKIETIKFSLWDGLQITILQTVLLLAFAIAITYWLMERSGKSLKLGLIALFGFVTLRSVAFINSNNQQKIVVYNVPQKTAIDFIDGRNYLFVGDSDLMADDFARNFHLKPSRILYRISDEPTLNQFAMNDNYISYKGKRILLINESVKYFPLDTIPEIDLLVIARNPKLYMNTLAKSVKIKQVVFDGSVPAWKTQYWKKDCDSLKIPWHDVSTGGAFVMKVD